ncbi:MAG: ABC transporter substrate-binding protein [Nevskia sp.]|nr:ABC transporter substrate-binding protein [Nevskia sp.]
MLKLIRSLQLACTLFLGLGFAASAADAPAAGAPDVALKNTVEQIRGLIKVHYAEYRGNQDKFFKTVDEVVVPRFDVPYIGQAVLGRNVRTVTPEQRERFTTAFKNMLVHSYGSAMLDYYNSVNINWMPPRLLQGSNEAMVNSVLVRDTGQSYPIGFRLHQVDGDWKIIDITVENISLVLNFRTQLNSEIKRTGIDDVIARMEKGEFRSEPVQQQAGAPAPGGAKPQ